MLKYTYPFFYQGIQNKLVGNTIDTIENSWGELNYVFSDAMETDLRDFDLKGNWSSENLIKENFDLF